MRRQPQVLRSQPQVDVPAKALLHPVLVPALRLLRPHEELDLHLLELPRPEDEVPRVHLVAERLPDLRHPERQLPAGARQHVLEVDEHPLRRLRPQIDDARLVLHRPGERLEQQVEHPRLGELPDGAAVRAAVVLDLVGAEAGLAVAAVDHRVRERRHVAAGDPHLRMHQDRRVHPDHVVALLHVRLPPGALDVVLHLHAERPVVPRAGETAVNLAALEDEASPLAQRHDLVHVDAILDFRHVADLADQGMLER